MAYTQFQVKNIENVVHWSNKRNKQSKNCRTWKHSEGGKHIILGPTHSRNSTENSSNSSTIQRTANTPQKEWGKLLQLRNDHLVWTKGMSINLSLVRRGWNPALFYTVKKLPEAKIAEHTMFRKLTADKRAFKIFASITKPLFGGWLLGCVRNLSSVRL